MNIIISAEKYVQGHSYNQFSKAAQCTGSPGAQGTADKVSIRKSRSISPPPLGSVLLNSVYGNIFD